MDIPTGRQFSVAPEYGVPVIDGELVTWPTRTGPTGMPAAWALGDLAQDRRWSMVPAATLRNARFLGYDLSGHTLVWGETDPASGRGRVVAQNVDDGALLLWRLRHYRTALLAAALLTGIFAAVVAYQALWVLSF